MTKRGYHCNKSSLPLMSYVCENYPFFFRQKFINLNCLKPRISKPDPKHKFVDLYQSMKKHWTNPLVF